MIHSPTPGTLPDGTRLGRTALRVSDPGATADFYRDVVGLAVLSESETSVTLGVDGTPLLVLSNAQDAPRRHRSEAGLYHNAFRVPSRAALGDALDRVREQWQLAGTSDHRVSEAIYLTDPAGNGVEIYHDYPEEEWPLTDDGMIRMGTDPLDLEPIEAAAEGGSQLPPGSDLGHVHLEVTSLEAFREFYVDALGFEVRVNVPEALFVAAGDYHHHVGANTWHNRTEPNRGRGLSWFEVVVPEASDVAAVRERLDDHGIRVTETDRGIELTDPDDIGIRFRAE